MFNGNLGLMRTKSGKLSLALVLSASYLFGVVYLNLWSDDFAALTDNKSNSIHMLRDARPVSALILFLTFELVKFNMFFVVLFKLLSLVGLILVGHFLLKHLPRDFENKWVMGLIVGIGLCHPSFQVQIHWLHMWLTPWLTLLSLYSYHAWCRQGYRNKVTGLFLLTTVLLAYPPMAFWIFSYAALKYLYGSKDKKLIFRAMFKQVNLFIVSYAFSAIISRLILYFFALTLNERVRFVSPNEFAEKIEWFITRPIVTSFRPFMIDSPSPIFAIISATPFIVFLGYHLYKELWSKLGLQSDKLFLLLLYLIWLFILPAAHLLVTSNNQFEFRMVPSLNFSVVYLVGISLFKMIEKCHLLKIFVIVMLLATTIVLTNIRFFELMYKPFNSNLTFFQNEIRQCDKQQIAQGFVILDSKAPFPHHKRLGDFSIVSDLEYPWVAKGFLTYYLRVHHIQSIEFSAASNSNIFSESLFCEIDIEVYRQLLLSD